MRLHYLVLFVACFSFLNAQVGVNTTSPNATFDIKGSPSSVATPDGLIVPKISLVELRAKTSYAADQTGALVYVTELSADPSTNPQTQLVDRIGYYYFDGTKWMGLGSVSDGKWELGGNEQTVPVRQIMSPSNYDIYLEDFVGTTDDTDLILARNKKPGIHLREFGVSVNGGFYGDGYNTSPYQVYPVTIKNRPSLAIHTEYIVDYPDEDIEPTPVLEFAKGSYAGLGPATMFELGRSEEPTTGAFASMTHLRLRVAGNNNESSLEDIAMTWTYPQMEEITLNGSTQAAFIPNRAYVGIAEDNPKERLDINGNLKLKGEAETITDGTTQCRNVGAIKFNPTDGNFYGCVGTANPGVWKKLHN